MAKQSKYDTAGNDISYDENSKYFTYEESKAGYIIITGTTNEAKGMTSLTTPRAYNEKRVLLIARGAFDGCSVLTDIYVTPGISQIGDGAFSGAPSLKKIHILNTDPDKTTVNNVTFGLIDGMVKGAKFYVPKGYAREFSASYFWSPYADYITEE